MKPAISYSDAFRAVEKERAKISDRLHNHLCQSVTGLRLTGERLLHHIEDGQSVTAEELAHFRALLQQTYEDVRFLYHEMQPPDAGESGLVRALQRLISRAPRTICCRAEFSPPTAPLDGQVALVFLRVAQEVIADAIASAAKELRVTFNNQGGLVVLKIRRQARGVVTVSEMLKSHAQALGVSVLIRRDWCCVSFPQPEPCSSGLPNGG